jgi:hypothetical protein
VSFDGGEEVETGIDYAPVTFSAAEQGSPLNQRCTTSDQAARRGRRATRSRPTARGARSETSTFAVASTPSSNRPANTGDGDTRDGRVTTVMLVREAPPESAAAGFAFDSELEQRIGGSTISLGATISTSNQLSAVGASSRVEGDVDIKGKLGRSFGVTIAHALARASLGVDESDNGYEVQLLVAAHLACPPGSRARHIGARVLAASYCAQPEAPSPHPRESRRPDWTPCVPLYPALGANAPAEAT